MDETYLSVENLTLRFGGLTALGDVSLRVRSGELVGIIGPNGAGKTSLFNVLTGVYPPSAGDVRAFGRSLVGLKPFEISRLGVVRTFQNIRLFKGLSVRENVLVALHGRRAPGLWSSLIARPGALAAEDELAARADALLARLDLADRAEDRAGGLPYGAQKRLEIARALAAEPTFLLLDEPAAGMNASESAWLRRALRSIRDDLKVGLLLIEHDMSVVMDLCERLLVLDHGQLIAEGPPAAVRQDPRVLAAYLGTKQGARA